MWAVASAAFEEDRIMIEAQQKIIDHNPGKRMVWIDADKGPGMFRQLMAKLMREEGTPVEPFPSTRSASKSSQEPKQLEPAE